MKDIKKTVTLEFYGKEDKEIAKAGSVCYIRFRKLKKKEFTKTEERNDVICDYSKKTGELTGIEFYGGLPLKVRGNKR
jgi:hypothetical protein